MKRSRPAGEERRREYLDRVLRLNPLSDPQGVLAMRRRALGLKPVREEAPAAGDRSSEQKRRAIRQHVERIQAEFWTLPLDDLRRMLSAIDLGETPELRPLVGRLRVAASCRSEFPKLASCKEANLGLVHAFKSVVVCPPTEAGPLRERFLKSITDRQRLRKVQRMVRIIQNDFPMLYQLERDWFETILKQKRASASRVRDEQYDSSTGFSLELGWPVVIVIIIVIRILLSVMR